MIYEIDERILVDLDYDIVYEKETRDEPEYFEFDYTINKVFNKRTERWFRPSRLLIGLLVDVIDDDKLLVDIGQYEIDMRMDRVDRV